MVLVLFKLVQFVLPKSNNNINFLKTVITGHYTALLNYRKKLI
jgi:hypothetical protein